MLSLKEILLINLESTKNFGCLYFQMTSKNYVLAMEYCDGGSLYSMLDQPKYFYGLPEEEFLIVLYDIGKVTSSCMSEMHVKFTFGFSVSHSIFVFVKQKSVNLSIILRVDSKRLLHGQVLFGMVYCVAICTFSNSIIALRIH